MSATDAQLDLPMPAANIGSLRRMVSPSTAEPVTDIDIALFAAQHMTRVTYGSPTTVHWMDKTGNHTTTGENTRDATINALLEWRSGANGECSDRVGRGSLTRFVGTPTAGKPPEKENEIPS
jgi:hypothetical protein